MSLPVVSHSSGPRHAGSPLNNPRSRRPAEAAAAPRWLAKGIAYLAIAGVLLYVALLLAPIWILLFAAILFAILLDGAASLLRERVFRNRLPDNQIAWVVAVVVLLTALLGALTRLLGPDVVAQMETLAEQLPKAGERLRHQISEALPVASDWLKAGEMARLLEPSSAAGQRIVQVFGSVVGALGSAAAVLIIGLYLAVEPRAYVRGCLKLVPSQQLAAAREVLEAAGSALRRWLVGRLSSMTVVCVLTTIALWLLGSPLALSLGLLAGLFTFIPFIGPLLSALPAVLLGFMDSPMQALWIALAYVVVQIIEGNLATPLIQAYAVALRPAVLLSAQLIAGSLFGLPGLIIATPLAVALTVFVQVLYVRRHLRKDVKVMGEQ